MIREYQCVFIEDMVYYMNIHNVDKSNVIYFGREHDRWYIVYQAAEVGC